MEFSLRGSCFFSARDEHGTIRAEFALEAFQVLQNQTRGLWQMTWNWNHFCFSPRGFLKDLGLFFGDVAPLAPLELEDAAEAVEAGSFHDF